VVGDQQQLLAAAQAARDGGRWQEAISLFSAASTSEPRSAVIRHNLALCSFGAGRFGDALAFARQATTLRPELWQSRMIEAKVHRNRGEPVESEKALAAILDVDPANASALAAMADLDLNEFGDPAAAAQRLRRLGGPDAELTGMMAALYLGEQSAEEQSDRLKAFSSRNLRLPKLPLPAPSPRARKRIGLISPLFSASPVYFLTFGAFAALSAEHEIICFDRGVHRDWATERFAGIAAEWHDVAHQEPATLSHRIAGADLDLMFDLGGWTDAPALAALSAHPARRMLTWVGGQSATTGLDVFDGWIGDEWQSPASLQPLYTESLINVAGGYCDYQPPDYLAKVPRPRKRTAIGLVGNPCKIVPQTVRDWPAGLTELVLIDRRYAHQRTRDRVSALLEGAGVRKLDFIVPQGHAAYLEALAGMRSIVNSGPYAGGLTLVEAAALDVGIIDLPGEGRLFCERHHLSHRVTRGRNPGLANEIGKLVNFLTDEAR